MPDTARDVLEDIVSAGYVLEDGPATSYAVLMERADAVLKAPALSIWRVVLDCDHELLVIAGSEKHALAIAVQEAAEHGTTVTNEHPAVAPVLFNPGLLVIYPGPFSGDAVVDRHGGEDDE